MTIRLLTYLLSLFTAVPPATPPEPPPQFLPFAVVNEKHVPYPAERAAKIYEYVLAQLARKVSYKAPPELHPNVTLVLGSERNQIDCRPSNDIDIACTKVELREWDAFAWADGVAVCAATQFLTRKEIDSAAKEAMAFAGITPDELKAGR